MDEAEDEDLVDPSENIQAEAAKVSVDDMSSVVTKGPVGIDQAVLQSIDRCGNNQTIITLTSWD